MLTIAPVADDRIERFCAEGWWRRDGTFLDDFRDNAKAMPDKPAIVSYVGETGGRVSLTYRELAERVDKCSLGLLGLGVGAGDVVSFQLPNWWQFPVIVYACNKIGAIPNPLPPIFRTREITNSLKAVESGVCIVPAAYRGYSHVRMMHALRDDVPTLRHVVVVGDPGDTDAISWDALLDAQSLEPANRELLDSLRPGPNDVAEIQFTSGTTGVPKGVVHTFNTLYASYRAMVEELQLGPQDVIHVPSTMAHQTGYLNGCLMALAEGMTAVYQDVWSAGSMLGIVVDEQVTYTSGAAPFLIDFLHEAASGDYDLSSLRYFRSGGAVVPPGLAQRLKDTVDAQLVVCWGMTENGVCTITRRYGTPDEVASSDGYPAPWVSLQVTDSEGQPLPPGEVGLLWVKSASQCVTYVPDATLYDSAFVDGWFNTGDLARLLPDGAVRITGRVKDVIVRGGENIPVLEVERAIAGYDAVLDVTVVAVPDTRLGERACAVVVPSLDAEPPTLQGVVDQLEGLGMAKQYWPEYLVVVEKLARMASGKIDKNAARVAAMERLGMPGNTNE
jgi:cyclohexanecarboxylate-CoA ligase